MAEWNDFAPPDPKASFCVFLGTAGISIPETARMWGVCPNSVRDRVRYGTVRFFRVNGRAWIHAEAAGAEEAARKRRGGAVAWAVLGGGGWTWAWSPAHLLWFLGRCAEGEASTVRRHVLPVSIDGHGGYWASSPQEIEPECLRLVTNRVGGEEYFVGDGCAVAAFPWRGKFLLRLSLYGNPVVGAQTVLGGISFTLLKKPPLPGIEVSAEDFPPVRKNLLESCGRESRRLFPECFVS